MAEPAKPRGRPFAKGNNLGKGRPKESAVISVIKKTSRETLMLAIAKVLTMPVAECEFLSENQSGRSCDALMASVMTKGIKSGNPMHAQFFMTYTFGKPLDYDPEEDEMIDRASELARNIPSEVITQILRGVQGEKKKLTIPTEGS